MGVRLHGAKQALKIWVPAGAGIFALGVFDYATGSELRVFPLYYAPISFLAWHRGRTGALIGAALCTAAWLDSNVLAGLSFSSQTVWVVNTLVQFSSFLIVGLLISTLRTKLSRERGLSRTDPLTALANRRGFYSDAGRVLDRCRRTERPVTVAYLDLDNFKAVNDTLGHDAGDDLLCRVAEHLRATIRPGDLCARLGGDEFVVLFYEVGPDAAAVILERLRASFAKVSPAEVPVSVSIGAVAFPAAPESVEQIVRRADEKMYEAKAAGGGRVLLEVAGTYVPPILSSVSV